jgi:hypothetical protein
MEVESEGMMGRYVGGRDLCNSFRWIFTIQSGIYALLHLIFR